MATFLLALKASAWFVVPGIVTVIVGTIGDRVLRSYKSVKQGRETWNSE